MPASIVLKVSKVNSGKTEYPRLILGDSSLKGLKLEPGDEVFVETRADCIIITPCRAAEEDDS